MSAEAARLIVVGGLPGVGKTCLSKEAARTLRAVYLRIDTIEQALIDSGAAEPLGPMGYVVAYRLAAENLRAGLTVVADCVNPLRVTRDAWRDVAKQAGAAIAEIEVVCSDPIEHRRRVESRASDIPALRLPTWQDVASREYEPWDGEHILIDTAAASPDQCVRELLSKLAKPDL
jgi:predicted kinase